jgi:hypothetical protein
MKLLLIISFAFIFFQDTPYKPKEEFELKLDLQFKPRAKPDGSKIEMERRTGNNTGMPAPYLFLNLKVLKPVAEEVRVKVINTNATLLNKKFEPQMVIRLDLGFVDDIKDRVAPHHLFVNFLSKDKTTLSKIEIFFEKDGTYLVNGEKRGKL